MRAEKPGKRISPLGSCATMSSALNCRVVGAKDYGDGFAELWKEMPTSALPYERAAVEMWHACGNGLVGSAVSMWIAVPRDSARGA